MTPLSRSSPAFAKNVGPITAALRARLPETGRVLELGSGPGEHVAHFAAEFPGIIWQPSEVPGNLASAQAWVDGSGRENLRAPIALDVRAPASVTGFDAVLCINIAHVMAWETVVCALGVASRALVPGGVMYLYGPWRAATRPFEPSNARFHEYLGERYPGAGVHDTEALVAAALDVGLELEADLEMPSNNRSLWLRRA